MDPGTGLTILGTALGSAKLVEKLLGPTADYLGAGVKDWTERGVSNLTRVFRNAAERLGDRLDEPGAVPPKVLKGIIEAGSFCDDELTAQYFGGVLASSRTGVNRDDRASAYIALLNRLSSYQIRAHYCFYHVLKLQNPEQVEEPCAGCISVPDFDAFMEFTESEDIQVLFDHIMAGLLRESLLKHSGTPHVNEVWLVLPDEDDVQTFCFGSTIAGIELFLWAHGKPNLTYQEFTDPKVSFDVVSGIQFDFSRVLE